MTKGDREEVREMIHDTLEGWEKSTVERENLIHQSLISIDKHLEKLNGSIVKHAEQIEELRINDAKHIVDCPVLPKVEALEQQIIGTWLRKHWKLALILFFVTLFVTNAIVDFLGIKGIITYWINK